MTDLLDLAIKAHGGLERWQKVAAVQVSFAHSGRLLEIKGYPGHRFTTLTIDARQQRAEIVGMDATDDRWIYTPQRVWIERPDGKVLEERKNPRAAFAGHERTTPWDRLHLTFFMGYAHWSYTVVPYLFTQPGFFHREIEPHIENGETWRVLEVEYPDSIEAHCKTQKFYFDQEGMLKRNDYSVDLTTGHAAHYSFDPQRIDGLVFPMLRRVVRRTEGTSHVNAPTTFLLDYSRASVRYIDSSS